MNDSLDMIISSLANLFAVTAVTEFALNWLVQSTLLIAAGLFLARMLQAKGSATQSLIFRTTLVAVLVCPLATWTLSQLGASGWSIRLPNYPSQLIQEVADAEITPDLDSSAPPAAAEPQALSVDESPISLPNHHLSEFPFQNQSLPAATDFDQSLAVEDSPNRELSEPNEPAEQPVVTDSTMATSDGPTTKSFNWLDLLTLCISICWITVSAVFLTRLIAAWWRLSRLVQRARPAEAATRQLCEELAAPIGVNVPEILRSPFLASPCLTGLGLTRRSSILLPEDDSHLPMRDVLVHELAHLRRHDVHWNLFRQVATAIYFFQPLLWVLSRRIEITAEEVCDDFVVQFGGDRERYATQLVDIAELSTDVSAAAVATAGVGIVALRSMLARRVERIMDGSRELSTRVGGLLLLLILIIGLVGTSAVGLVGLNNAPTLGETVVETTESDGNESKSSKLESETPSEPLVDGNRDNTSKPQVQKLEYSGQVLDTNGKPVAGANIYHVYYMPKPMGLFEPTSKPVTTSGDDGRFRFEFTRDGSLRSSNAAKYGTAFATKKGFGFGIAHREHTAQKPEEVLSLANRSKDIHLLKDHPIRGRIVNIDGEPVAGARLILTRLSITANNDLSSWNEAAKEPNAYFYSVLKNISNIWRSPQLPSLVAPITTDRDGRFEVRGIGEGQIAHFHLSGPSIETAIVSVRTDETGDTITLPLTKQVKTKISFTYYPSNFEHVAGPSVPVSGVVIASDTGDPISGATVKSEGADRDIVRAITDENGRYRLEGLPIRERNNIAVLVPSGTSNDGDEAPAYLSMKKTVSTTGPVENMDIKMERGSWLFGKITDSETGKGLSGCLEYRIPENLDSLGQVYESDRWVSGQDGRFRIAVPRGRGYILFAPKDDSGYPLATEILSLDGKLGRASEVKKMYPSVLPCLIAEYQADEDNCERNLVVVKGLVRKGKVVGPDKQPITDFRYLSRKAKFGGWDKSSSDAFSLECYEPDSHREVYFVSRAKNLTGRVIATGPADEPLVVELKEGGTVTGRLVDEDGEPLSRRQLTSWKAPQNSSADVAKFKTSASLPFNAKHDRGFNETDEDGKFTLTCLLPDTEYRVEVRTLNPSEFPKSLGVVIKVKAGETKDLGDIPIAEYDAYLKQPAATQGGETPAKSALNESAENSSAATVSKQTARTVFTTEIKLPDDQPAASAHVALVGVDLKRSGSEEVIAEQVTDGSGSCRFVLSGVSADMYDDTKLIARKDGYAVAWKKVAIDAAEAISIDLAEEQIIRGRLSDIDGEPATGEHLVVASVMVEKTDTRPGSGTWFTPSGKCPKAWVPSVVSDGDGRFAIHGVPRGYGVYASLTDSENFAPQSFKINTGQSQRSGGSLVENAPDGKEVSLTLSPAQLFTGKITSKDSGKPIANARIKISASQEEFGTWSSIEGKTDDEGNYRVIPDSGTKFRVSVFPPSGSPYLAAVFPNDLGKSIKWEGSDQSRTVDLSLERGVLVRGRVLEDGTDKPVTGAGVIYEPVKNKTKPKNLVSGWQNDQTTDEKGEFTFAVPAGTGIFQVNHWENKYVYQTRVRVTTRTYAHAFHKINAKVAADLQMEEIRLTPGNVVNGEVVDESGSAGGRISSHYQSASLAVRWSLAWR